MGLGMVRPRRFARSLINTIYVCGITVSVTSITTLTEVGSSASARSTSFRQYAAVCPAFSAGCLYAQHIIAVPGRDERRVSQLWKGFGPLRPINGVL